MFKDGGGRERVELCALPLGFFDARAILEMHGPPHVISEERSNFKVGVELSPILGLIKGLYRSTVNVELATTRKLRDSISTPNFFVEALCVATFNRESSASPAKIQQAASFLSLSLTLTHNACTDLHNFQGR